MSTIVTPARRAASDVLLRVAQEGAFASNLIASFRYDHLSPEDHGLMQELVMGVLRWQLQLDFFIERYARRSPEKLDSEVVAALRLGLYQLKFLSRIPAHAAINESVNLVKEYRKMSAAPLVNAVLRKAQRDTSFTFNQVEIELKDPIRVESIETSHPLWLFERWYKRYGGIEARDLAFANNLAPTTAFRFIPQRNPEQQTRAWLGDHGIAFRESEISPGAFVIENGSLSPQSEPVSEGWIYLQDEASQLVAHMAANHDLKSQSSDLKSQSSALKFLDLCAAPGSKTTLIASLLPKNSLIVACDLHLHRLRTMKELAARFGDGDIPSVVPVVVDATKELPFAAGFDSILLDAPCSGLGTLSRNPEIKWRMSEAKILELAELQKRLLENAARHLRPGGLLTYSVCSTEPEEGEDMVAQFRASHHEFRDMTRERLVELGLDPGPLLTSTFGARTFPHRHHTEGFFFCTLWKRI